MTLMHTRKLHLHYDAEVVRYRTSGVYTLCALEEHVHSCSCCTLRSSPLGHIPFPQLLTMLMKNKSAFALILSKHTPQLVSVRPNALGREKAYERRAQIRHDEGCSRSIPKIKYTRRQKHIRAQLPSEEQPVCVIGARAMLALDITVPVVDCTNLGTLYLVFFTEYISPMVSRTTLNMQSASCFTVATCCG